jgi:hypothetical protein
MKLDLEWGCKGELECLQIVEKGIADIVARLFLFSMYVSQRKW